MARARLSLSGQRLLTRRRRRAARSSPGGEAAPGVGLVCFFSASTVGRLQCKKAPAAIAPPVELISSMASNEGILLFFLKYFVFRIHVCSFFFPSSARFSLLLFVLVMTKLKEYLLIEYAEAGFPSLLWDELNDDARGRMNSTTTRARENDETRSRPPQCAQVPVPHAARPGFGWGTRGVTKVGRVDLRKFEEALSAPNPTEALDELIDPSLQGDYPVDSALKIASLAKSCTHEEPGMRPTMRSVVVALMALTANTDLRDMDYHPF
ncbi:hypothetical protein OsI_32009 [Oryza sativa Indica Group]|uniref:Uncharacterized protein n=1 Tax=Oryza sativa subsp. indica TaxID=39946 RepID=B8BDL6_ORYSI|nr:hypothetical protein OsI_32009 [Oryza sativa Indica Group]